MVLYELIHERDEFDREKWREHEDVDVRGEIIQRG